MKFTIRDLLLVTVIAALAVGWWVERSRRVTEVEKAKSLQLTINKLESQLIAAELNMRVRELEARQASQRVEMLQLQMDLQSRHDSSKK